MYKLGWASEKKNPTLTQSLYCNLFIWKLKKLSKTTIEDLLQKGTYDQKLSAEGFDA